jgi:hypothetical protein
MDVVYIYEYARRLAPGSGRRREQALDDFVGVVVMDRQQLGHVWRCEAHLVEDVVRFHELLHLGSGEVKYLSV